MKEQYFVATHTERCVPVRQGLRAAIVADLHNRPAHRLAEALRAWRPDVILIPGDLMETIEYGPGDYHRLFPRWYGCDHALDFLEEMQAVAPVCYTTGNHDAELSDRLRAELRRRGVHVLCRSSILLGDYRIGGLADGDDSAWLRKFSTQPGFRILLCHRPERYQTEVRRYAIGLTVAGHAHGGQWRFFGRGIYAPGQGFFPRYTAGFYDHGRLLVSRGLANNTHIPRILNPPELLLLELRADPEKAERSSRILS